MAKKFKHTKKQARALFIEALRSGPYEQGSTWLCEDVDGCCLWCALGVACDVFQRHEWVIDEGPDADGVHSFAGMDSACPAIVCTWLGLSDECGHFDGGTLDDFLDDDDEEWRDDGPSIADLSDYGVSFPEIADIIESEPEGLFA